MREALTFVPGSPAADTVRLERAWLALNADVTRARLLQLLYITRDPEAHRLAGQLYMTFNSLACLLTDTPGDVE